MQSQRVHFTNTSDGVSIAYSSQGSGQPLLISSGWVSHLELDLASPHNAQFIEKLNEGVDRRLIRYDIRGCGLSDRDVEDLSVEARARDIEAVVKATGLDKVAIFAWSMNGPAAIVYAATHPEKVSHLILYGTYARHHETEKAQLGRALVDLIRADWRIGSRAIVDFEYPDADKDIADSINHYQHNAATGAVAATILEEALFSVDVTSYLPRLTMPVLVMHRRDDKAFPASCARELASLVPHAHYVPLAGSIHLPFLGDSQAIIDAVNEFLLTSDGHSTTGGGHTHEPQAAAMRVSPGLQIILFTDMEGSTGLTQRMGDEQAQELVRLHNSIVRDALREHGGAEIKHTGDGIMASFISASGAIECATAVQRAIAEHCENEPDSPIRVRIGLNAGEPVAEGEDLFGTAVQLAARVAAHAEPGQILVSDVVRQLAAGKGLLFSDLGTVPLRGFEDPVRLFAVRA